MTSETADVKEAQIADLQAAMAEGRLTASALVDAYERRIERFDQDGPSLNSVLELNPDRHEIAGALDRERQSGRLRGPLHGVPILLKDNIDTADGLHTSAGSLALKDSHARADAPLVRRLRDAGAIILGKTNMTEWANFMSVGMKSGFSSRGGQVRNAYGDDLEVSGSSSGSAVAVAASLCAAAVGTETSGSIISPASNNSVVGMKPTVGLISRRGIIPISPTQDTAGPFGRTVADAATLLDVLTGIDRWDPATSLRPAGQPASYSSSLVSDGLRGARIGVPRRAFWDRVPDEAREVLEARLEHLVECGATLIDPSEIADADTVRDLRADVLLYEFRPALNRYLRRLGRGVPVHSLRELIRFHEARPEEMLRYGQTLLLAAEATGGTGMAAYRRALLEDRRLAKVEGLDATLARDSLDALVFPGSHGAGIGAKAGYPSITVPAGYATDRMPISLTFLGPAWSEPLLIRLAYSFEQSTRCRLAPSLGDIGGG